MIFLRNAVKTLWCFLIGLIFLGVPMFSWANSIGNTTGHWVSRGPDAGKVISLAVDPDKNPRRQRGGPVGSRCGRSLFHPGYVRRVSRSPHRP